MVDFNTETSEEKAHAEYSASGSERWMNCPGSHALAKKAPAEPPNRYAKEGTEAHACLEFILKNRRSNMDPVRKMALKNWPTEMVEHAINAWEWINARYLELGGAQGGVDFLCETKVDSSPFLCAGQFGTLDCALVQHFGTLVVIDYKYGAGYVRDPQGEDGKGDSQLVYYALALSYAYEHNFQNVEFVIIQPRAFHASGETIRTHTISMETLLSWHQVFRNALMETNNPDAELRAGKWCQFCRAKVICPEIRDRQLKTAKAVFSETEGLTKLPDPKLEPIPNLAVMLKAADKLEHWIEGLRQHAYFMLSKGKPIPGYKLVEKRATRKWKDEKVAAKAAAGFGARAFTERKLLSVAQFEKALKGHKLGAKFVTKHSVKESTGYTVVQESDNRPAIRTMKDIFGALPDGDGAVSGKRRKTVKKGKRNERSRENEGEAQARQSKMHHA